MKDGIKEILINKLDAIEELNKNSATIMIGELKEIIVYITNLQTIEQQYGFILSENAELENKITNLQEEKDYYFKKNNELSKLNTSLRNDRDIYKTRNDKAIEYIEFEQKYSIPYKEELIELSNILQGKSDE